ncbi:family 10 glycosylhydrolase [Methylosinus sporium]|uniref:family 10 glycosylhydrolase n=1 Tax=Methylosinus sporium TaxID=428 RepID=UPI003839E6B1
MTQFNRGARKLFSVIAILCIQIFIGHVVILFTISEARAATDVILDAGAPIREHLVYLGKFGLSAERGALRDAYGKSLIGWAEFEFIAHETGWRKFNVDVEPFLGATRFSLDSEADIRSLSLAPNEWVWIEAGLHVVRVEQTNWTGFPSIRSITFKAAHVNDGPPFRLLSPAVRTFVSGKCPELVVEVGGAAERFILRKSVVSDRSSEQATTIVVDPSNYPTHLNVQLPCILGDYRISLVPMVSGHEYMGAAFDYTVFGCDQVEPTFAKGRLLQEIDLTATPPEFGGGVTSIESSQAGSYRVTESRGFTLFQRSSTLGRGDLLSPSWFAYRIKPPNVQRPYILEVEYPDDAARAFVVSVRAADSPPLSFGVETGVIWPLSKKAVREEARFWASSSDMRVVVMNTHDGMKAGVSKIRLYEVEERMAARAPITTDRRLREVRVWDEQGESFYGVVGAKVNGDKIFDAVDRWLRGVKFLGATTVSPTVAVYASQLYPSYLLSMFSPPQGRDILRAILIDSERYGLHVMPQLAPRADEIATGLEKPDSRFLMSRRGELKLFGREQAIERPPYYNPLDPAVGAWYVAAVGEIADRYKDYSAFDGVDLRIMAWADPALNNLVSLEWGYDSSTVARFVEESGISAPADLIAPEQDDSVMAPRRFDFVMQYHREAWIAWRCHKIYELFERLRDRVKKASPRLRLSVTLASVATSENGIPSERELKEAGLDISLLSQLTGLELVDGFHSYGAREGGEMWLRRLHDQVMDETSFLDTRDPGRGRSIMVRMQYIEIVGGVVSSVDLGFRHQALEYWASAASNPPGRVRLDRLANVLGETDAVMLGDGGNSYVFGSEVEREFLDRYRRLPAVPFSPVASQSDSVAAWQSGRVFYLVNMTPFSIVATLNLEAHVRLTQVHTDDELRVRSGVAVVDLKPFELLVLNADRDDALIQVDARLNDEDIEKLKSAVERIKAKVIAACKIATDKYCRHLERRSNEEQGALSRRAFRELLRLIEATENQTIVLGN